MSAEDSLQARWPSPEADLTEHRRALWEGFEAIQDRMVVPGDRRFEAAYALLVTGRGQDSSVSAQGDAGTGKTTFGDMLFGGDLRVEIADTDSEATLYGHRNPIKPEEYVAGKLVGLQEGNPTAYMNEVPHLKSTGDLHRLWDSEHVEIDGRRVPLSNVAIYITGNFPDNARNHPYDDAFRSRQGIEILAGDHDHQTAAKVQEDAARMAKNNSAFPILPVAGVRASVASRVEQLYPAGSYGEYIVKLIHALNETQLITPINVSDARIGKSMLNVARACLFSNSIESTQVMPKHLAPAAGLALPTLVDISAIGRYKMEEALGRRTSPFERAVAMRRVVARMAFTALLENDFATSAAEKQTTIEMATERYSYANAAALGYDVDQILFGGPKVITAPPTGDERIRRRGWGIRRTSR